MVHGLIFIETMRGPLRLSHDSVMPIMAGLGFMQYIKSESSSILLPMLPALSRSME